jgi:Icc protein
MTQNSTSIKQLDVQQYDCVRVIQLTDSHIFGADSGKLLGLNTRTSFEAVLNRVGKEELAPDLFLATGDLSQDASDDSYLYFQQQMAVFAKPVFWIPGNHDDPKTMARSFSEKHMLPHRRILAGQWQIVMLDTSVPKKVYGQVSDDDLQLLTRAIEDYPSHHLLVVMHHQPVPVGSEWLDNLGIKNPQQLFGAVTSHKAKVCFLWGHVHQDFQGEQQGVQLISTPSTCVQFKPGSDEFSAGVENPGYRYLTLYNDGRVETVLHRIDNIEFTVDYSIKGY